MVDDSSEAGGCVGACVVGPFSSTLGIVGTTDEAEEEDDEDEDGVRVEKMLAEASSSSDEWPFTSKPSNSDMMLSKMVLVLSLVAGVALVLLSLVLLLVLVGMTLPLLLQTPHVTGP